MSDMCPFKGLRPAVILAICAGAACAQPIANETSDVWNYMTPSLAAPKHEVPSRIRESWWWVHAGVTAQLAGNFGDWATSWKQPEGNGTLAQSGGEYAGRFYRTGTVVKFGMAAGVAGVSYLLGWKWPHTRKFVGIFNMTMGGGFAVQAIRNAVVNPYYKP